MKKYLRSNKKPKYNNTNNNDHDIDLSLLKSAKSKWDKFKNEIIDMYCNKEFIGSRIFNKLKSRGATGSETGFYEYFKKIKQTDTAKKIWEKT